MIPAGTRVVSFVARSLDRLRGLDRFLELAERCCGLGPTFSASSSGDPIVRRGLDVVFHNRDYAAHLLAEQSAVRSRAALVPGPGAPAVVAEVLAASDLHVAPSRPYPVARSLLEAMAAGCVVLASDTEPHREVMTPGETGLLVDERRRRMRWRKQALAVLADPAAFRPLGDAAARWCGERLCPGRLPAQARRRVRRAGGRQGRVVVNVLFIHDAFPAQFGRLGLELTRRRGWQCGSWCRASRAARLRRPRCSRRSSCTWCPWRPSIDRATASPGPRSTAIISTSARRSTTRSKAMPQLRPDLVVAHGGRGRRRLFLREVVDCPIIIYCEYYFADSHRDISYRIDLPPAEPAPFFPRCINAPTLATLVDCDAGYSATHWQKQSFPAEVSSKIEVHFDGIDTELYSPARAPADRRPVDPGRHAGGDVRLARAGVDPRVRSLHEGRPSGLPGALRRDLRGGRRRRDPLRLGQAAHRHPSFKEWVLKAQESDDLDRFIFTGRILPEQLAAIFRLSDLHIYLTAPFVLSWSLLDAMASGCVVLASDVPPVREVIEPGQNGLIEPLFDVDRLTETALRGARRPGGIRPAGPRGASRRSRRNTAWTFAFRRWAISSSGLLPAGLESLESSPLRAAPRVCDENRARGTRSSGLAGAGKVFRLGVHP